MTFNPLARKIDHTLLKAEASEDAIRKLCSEALEYGFYSVCVNPRWVELAAQLLANPGRTGERSLAITVVGFPLGASRTGVKAFEAGDAVQGGAGEIDMVLDVGSVKSGDWERATADIRAVVRASQGVPVKVILETCYLSDEEIRRACLASRDAGAAFVKTSTGFGSGGATEAHVRWMRATVGPDFGVKASGGIRDHATAQAMVQAGANRLGCSASVAIVAASTLKGNDHGY